MPPEQFVLNWGVLGTCYRFWNTKLNERFKKKKGDVYIV